MYQHMYYHIFLSMGSCFFGVLRARVEMKFHERMVALL